MQRIEGKKFGKLGIEAWKKKLNAECAEITQRARRFVGKTNGLNLLEACGSYWLA
jgi:hypothetical protein